MAVRFTIHYDNLAGLARPHLRLWHAGANPVDLALTGGDEFGPLWELSLVDPELTFTFTASPGAAQTDGHDRRVRPLVRADGGLDPGQAWCRGDRAFVYPVRPADPQPEPAVVFLERLAADPGFPAGLELPSAGGRSGLGASLLADGRVLFGLYHPTAARVFVAGSFNDWQHPGHQRPDPDAFVELELFRGWFGAANTWLAVTDRAGAGDEYRFWVQGGTPPEDAAGGRLVVDPYARQLGPDAQRSNAVVVDPTTFAWSDRGWSTPDPADLILYEVSVHGFTDGDPDIRPDQQGRFDGITERIRTGYFDSLGVTALSLMPLAEVPSMQGPQSLGYDPSLYHAVERDFGGPDDLRRLVDAAHGRGLALLVDMVFNHTSNDFNPLWDLILEQPDDVGGGLYFNGATPWGNRVATEKADVQNLLIDACRMLVGEYHVDGFRLDATHTDYMDHGFLHRLAAELKTGKPDVLLVAENLPNQGDLNLEGWNGYAQWSELFHDKLKALLREGQFEGQSAGTDNLDDTFYFSRSR
ncbi:MAG TPA: alpha-amylase family glycosyl hydrolase, partial [Actinomycetota bacterium]|nr:alpha-amylase family glycosyl hydrolase [Actinomycetota bacterium]